MNVSHAFFVGLLLGALSACGFAPRVTQSDAGSPFSGGAGGGLALIDGGALDAGLPVRAACATLNARRCEFLRGCGLIDDSTEGYRACVAWLSATWCGPSRWPARVEAGTLRYDPVRALACASDWQSRACSDFNVEPVTCQRFLSPGVPLRGACYGGYPECAEGVCRGAACPRACAPRGGDGEVCVEDADCQADRYCKPPTGSAAAGTCVRFGSEGASCSEVELCAKGFQCSASRCRRLPGPGESCLGGLCDETAFCFVTGDGGVCAGRRDAGTGCGDDSQCGEGFLCDDGQRRCVPVQVAAVGGECSPRQRCPAATVCIAEANQPAGTCIAPRAFGAPCQVATDCQSHLTCREGDGGRVCGLRLPNGSACTSGRDCQVLSSCASGSCVPLPTLQEPCGPARPCQWGACVSSVDAGDFCVDLLPAGQTCLLDRDCASGRCDRGQCSASCLP